MGQLCSQEEARAYINKDLGIPLEREVSESVEANKHTYHCLISSKWLHAVYNGTHLKIDDELQQYKENSAKLSEVFQRGYQLPKNSSVINAFVTVLKKDVNFTVICDNESVPFDSKLIYSALQNQQKHTKNLFDAYLSLFQNEDRNANQNRRREISLEELKDFFKTTFNVPTRSLNVLQLKQNEINCSYSYSNDSYPFKSSTPYLPVLAVLESSSHVYVFEKSTKYNLNDALLYSPALLGKSHMSLRFLLYQMMQLLRDLSKHSLTINTNLQLKDFYLQYNTLWIGASLFDCVSIESNPVSEVFEKKFVEFYKGQSTNLSDNSIRLTKTLSEYTGAWIEGRISNFDYLIILNKLAGKKFGEPWNHPIFPWVTDFSCRNGGLRNLKRTKFRLNKGDHQLEATFTGGVGAYGYVQHHVSDVLSEITFYIYHARSTSKETLCNHVRSRWVPDEYPVSIERMYNWTPDECIPEFFYDPNIFTSMHEDLCDLKLPGWINSRQEFVDYHYDILESAEVSENLHHWIDLIFGYKLEGKAAKRELNVHLSLVDGHKDLKNYGVVQLFNCHHPKKKVIKKERLLPMEDSYNEVDGADRPREFSMSWEYIDLTSSMKINNDSTTKTSTNNTYNNTNDNNTILSSDQEDFKFIKKSTRNLSEISTQPSVQSTAVTATTVEDFEWPGNVKYQVADPEKKAFLDIMERTEKMLQFELMANMPGENGLGKYEFGTFSRTTEDVPADPFGHLEEKVKLFLCLLMEITCHKVLCTRTFMPELDERLATNWKFMKGNKAVPSWVKESVESVLFTHPSEEKFSISPSSALCLNTLLMSTNGCFHFPSYFKKMYEFLFTILSLAEQSENQPCSSSNSENNQAQQQQHVSNASISQKIESCSKDLPLLLERLDEEGVDLMLVYLNPLFERESVQIPMFLFVFPALSIALGQIKSRRVFLKGLQQLMDRMNSTVNEPSLMQQMFLSHILSGFGQDYFLRHFMSQLLDILSSQRTTTMLSSGHSLEKATSLSTIPTHDMVLPSDSMVSYEVSPCLATDSISLSSFNLDVIFGGVGDGDQCPDGDIPDDDENEPEPRQSTTDGSSKPASLTLPVLSSQEIGDSMINVEAGSQSLPNFSFKQLDGYSSQEGDIEVGDLAEDGATEEDFSGALKSPFTILLEKDSNEENDYDDEGIRDRATTDLSEVLEVPLDETIEIPTTVDQENLQQDLSSANGVHKAIVQSVQWFISWLGPNLTTEFIALPLLRKMGKIFIEVENELSSLPSDDSLDIIDCFLEKVQPHIECLTEVAAVYGDNIVIYLFLPHVAKLVENATMSSSVSISLGSNLVAGVQLLMETCKLLQGEVVVTYMEEFSVGLFQPLIRLLSTVKPFSTGVIVKEFLSRKLIDILGHFCQKLRREYAQEVMAALLQQFFSCFDGIYALRVDPRGETTVARKYSLLCSSVPNKDQEKRIPNTKQERNQQPNGGDDFESNSSSAMLRISQQALSIDDVLEKDEVDSTECDVERFDDIYETFSSSLAHHAFVLFSRVLGTLYVEKTLYNIELIYHLFKEHDDQFSQREANPSATPTTQEEPDGQTPKLKRSISKWLQTVEASTIDDGNIINSLSWQNLDGAWLKHWKDWSKSPLTSYQFSNYKLQTYAGHSSAIRDICVADNEHYFLSASRDKTVKLWLLKNHGNGTAHLGCSGTYDRHARGVFSVQGIESKRLAASCDGAVNIWDPVTTTTISQFDGSRGHTITSMRTLPQPSVCVAVATTEGNLRLYDVRENSFVQDWKLSPQPNTGMVRSMCVNESGTLIASGFSSGVFSVVDLRAGILKGQAFLHDGEIIQMESVPGYGFLCSSADSHIKLWCEDGKVSVIAKASNESLNSMIYSKQQLLWATSTNKLMIHKSDKIMQCDVHRISPDFKGGLSKMAVLPTNRLFLFGADNGNLVLYA